MYTPKLLFLVTLIMVLFSCGSSEDQKEESNAEQTANETKTKEKIEENLEEINVQDRILQIKAAKIEFKYSGKWTGTETVWFDQYGNQVVIDQDIQFSEKIHKKQRIIWNVDKEKSLLCTYEDMEKPANTCEKVFIRPKDTELSIFSHGDESQLKYGYDSQGTKDILGKEAAGWKSKSSDEIIGWIWKGIDLAYSNLGVEKEAISIEEIESIDPKLLEMPEGFTMR